MKRFKLVVGYTVFMLLLGGGIVMLGACVAAGRFPL